MADSTLPKQKAVLADRYSVPPEQLSDGEVTLRRWYISEAQDLYVAAAASLPELQLWMPWAADGYTLADAATFIRAAADGWDKGEAYNYAVVVEDRVVGSFGLMPPARGGAGMGMGYWLATAATGRGLATRAAALLTDAAFEAGAEMVQIWHRAENGKSRAVPQRLGYRYLGEHHDLPIAECGLMGLWQKDRPEQDGR